MNARMIGSHELPERISGPVVVIDVLRAFTTAAWALAGGASPFVLAATDTEALNLKRELGPEALAVRDGARAPGFDLANSPGQIRRSELRGRPVVQKTTNGTVAAHAAMRAEFVSCAALVNATATCRWLQRGHWDSVTYIITGERGRAEEDLACAQYIQALVEGNTPGPQEVLDRVRGSGAAQALREAVAAGYSGVSKDDIDLAVELDAYDFVMLAERGEDGRIELRAH